MYRRRSPLGRCKSPAPGVPSKAKSSGKNGIRASLEISAINLYKYSLFTANAGNGSTGGKEEPGTRSEQLLLPPPGCSRLSQCPLSPHSMDPSPLECSCLSPRLGWKPTTSFPEIPRILIPRSLLVMVQPSSHGLSQAGNPRERFRLPWELGMATGGGGQVLFLNWP